MLTTNLSGIEQLERKDLFASLLGETADPILDLGVTQDAADAGPTTFYAVRNGSDTAATQNQLWGDWFFIDDARAVDEALVEEDGNTGKPLLIIAEDIEGEALATF